MGSAAGFWFPAAFFWPRSNADKRKAVEVALREFSELSSEQIAAICGVSYGLTHKIRADSDVLTINTSPEPETITDSLGRQQPARKPRKEAGGEVPHLVTGADGKERPAHTMSKIGENEGKVRLTTNFVRAYYTAGADFRKRVLSTATGLAYYIRVLRKTPKIG